MLTLHSMKHLLLLKFGNSLLSDEEKGNDYDLRTEISLASLLLRVKDVVHIEFHDMFARDVYAEAQQDEDKMIKQTSDNEDATIPTATLHNSDALIVSMFGANKPIDLLDIVDDHPAVREIPMAAYALGSALFVRSRRHRFGSSRHTRLCQESHRSLLTSIRRGAGGEALCNLGYLLESGFHDSASSMELYKYAAHHLHHPRAYLYLAMSHSRLGRCLGGEDQKTSSREAKRCLDLALELSPNYKNVLKELGNSYNFRSVTKLITHQDNYINSQLMYERVLLLDKGHLRSGMNYVRLLGKKMHQYKSTRKGSRQHVHSNSVDGANNAIHNSDSWKQNRAREVVETMRHSHPEHVECLCFTAEFLIKDSQHSLGIEDATKACTLALARIQTGEGIRNLGWDGTMRMYSSAMKLARRLSFSVDGNSGNKTTATGGYRRINNRNWRTKNNVNTGEHTASTASTAPTYLFTGTQTSSSTSNTSNTDKRRHSNILHPKGIHINEQAAKTFQNFYWKLENYLRLYIAREIVRDSAVIPPTVDDTQVLVHAAHHCFRVEGATPECFEYAETACELALQTVQTCRTLTDPFAKRSCAMLMGRIRQMLETLEQKCLELGDFNANYLEIGKKLKSKLEDFKI